MDKIFQIGSFCFRICCKNPIPIPYNFLLFANPQKTEADYTYHLSLEKKFDLPSQRIIAKRPDLLVMGNDKYESRLIGSLGGTSYYAFYREISECDAKVQIALHKTSDLLYDTVFTSMFALERQMTRRDSMILHCAYIKYRGTAILFSAPSETGKSTQAGLWEKYRGSETVNGDRALLRKIDGRWTACGWPVCGTSEICHPEDIPIHAVAMLRQGKENYVERLSPVQAFTQLYSQITVNQWNREFVQRTVELIEDFVEHVPVWQLTCDISENAVQCLEAALFPTNISGKGGICYEV